MTIVQLSPLSLTALSDVDTFHHQMNRLFDGLADNLASNIGCSTSLRESERSEYTPKADLLETDEALILTLEVPGINPEQLAVEVTTESVSVKGERQSHPTSIQRGKTSMHRSEFRYGKFHRVISLPVQIQQTNVEANYKNGILSLTLPKVVEEKDKVVKVTIR